MTTPTRTARLSLIAGLCAPLLGHAALADNKFWTNAAGGDFSVATNWSGGVPGVTDIAVFNLAATYTVNVPNTPENFRIIVRNGNPTLVLNAMPGYIVTDETFVGDQGGFVASMTMQGGRLETPRTSVGLDHFSNGTLNVGGPGAQWVSTVNTSVGLAGTGVMNITGGASAELANTYIGELFSAADGRIRLSGNGTTATFTGALSCGDVGKGLLRIENGAVATAVIANFGNGFTGAGKLEVVGNGSSFSSSDPTLIGTFGFGQITITGGALVTSNQGIMAVFADSEADGVVSGANSRWISYGTFQVGREGDATLELLDGGRVEANGNAFLGSLPGRTGTLLVDGAGSRLQCTQQLQVGREGIGALTVTNGGVVTSTGVGSASQAAGLIGGFGTGVGDALISGVDSRWTMTNGSMNVGFLGQGELVIENSGRVESPSGFVGRMPNSSGVVDIHGAASHWTNTGPLRVGVDPAGADGGSGTLRLHNGGRIAATTLTVGTLGTVRGVGQIEADVTSRGLVVAGSPLGQLSIIGSYTQIAGGEFRATFAPTETVSHGALMATGPAALAGTIRVSLQNNAVPEPGSYVVLGAASLSGSFTTIELPPNTPERTYSLQYTPTSVIVKVQGDTIDCPGDANGDGVVDFADFSIVLAQYGMTGPNLDGDLNGDGVVDFTDLSEVLAHYGVNCAP